MPVLIEVEDTGIGIPPAELQRIFESFSQVSGQSTKKYGGTGLGLAITRRLTEMMGGIISVRSQEGEGSCFSMRFDKLRFSDLQPVASPVSATLGFDHFRPACVLVADDVPLNLELIRGYFLGSPLKIVTAENGEEALRCMRAEHPDLVLMDVRMPVMDGVEAIRQMKADPLLKNLPVVAFTASILQSEEKQVQQLADGFLRKPFKRAELLAELARHLECAESTSPNPITPVGVELIEAPVAAELSTPAALRLQQLLDDDFVKCSKTMSMKAIGSFAVALRQFSEQYELRQLNAFALRLAAAVSEFDLDIVRSLLTDFPSLATAHIRK